MKPLLTILLFLITSLGLFAQDGVGIGITTPDESAILHVDAPSDNKGMLVPRLTILERNNINNPAEGLIIYNETDQAFNYYDGSSWIRLIPTPAKFSLDMSNNKISNIADGTEDGDAVNKLQTETISLAVAQQVVENEAVLKEANTASYTKVRMSVIEIGVWNMDAISSLFKAYPAGSSFTTIRSVTGIIRSDNGAFYPIPYVNEITNNSDAGISLGIAGFNLGRRTDGIFDGTSFDSNTANRGWLTVIFESN